MPCPTCSGTMQNVLTGMTACVYWCPRCGTIRRVNLDSPPSGDPEDAAPKLVGRVQTFLTGCGGHPAIPNEFHRLGITEAIYRPEERPT